MKLRDLVVMLVTLTLTSISALAESPAVGILSMGGEGSEGASHGQIDVVVPVASLGDNGVLLVNPRIMFSDSADQELNLGLVYRHMFDDSVILGANAYYDSRWTEAGNHFGQVGVGLEALTKWVDLRANYYIPEHAAKEASSSATDALVGQTSGTGVFNAPYATGHTIVQEFSGSFTNMYEKTVTALNQSPMEGFDAELGVLLPLPEKWGETRLFAAYYRFESDTSGTTIEGVRGRAEIRPMPGLVIDAEVYDDDELNGTEYFVGGRLQLPFDLVALARGKNPFAGTAEAFQIGARSFDDRMVESVVRDLHIRFETVSAEPVVSQYNAVETGIGTNVVQGDTIFVNNETGSAGGAGTAEDPVNTIQAGVDRAFGTDNNVYVYGTDTWYDENVLIVRGCNLVGGGSRVAGGGGHSFAGARPKLKNAKNDLEPMRVRLASDDATTVRIEGLWFRSTHSKDAISVITKNRQDLNLSIRDNEFRQDDYSYGKSVDLMATDSSSVMVDLANNVTISDSGDFWIDVEDRARVGGRIAGNRFDAREFRQWGGCVGLYAKGNGRLDLEIRENVISDTAYHGIDILARDDAECNLRILKNRLYWNGLGSGDTGSEIDYYGMRMNANGNSYVNAEISKNVIEGSGERSTHFSVDDNATAVIDFSGNTTEGTFSCQGCEASP